jgi:hypothetical protein
MKYLENLHYRNAREMKAEFERLERDKELMQMSNYKDE